MYNLGMMLLSVQLDSDDARKAASVIRDGVEISSLVREAIRAEYDRRAHRQQKAQSAAELINAAFTSAGEGVFPPCVSR